MADSEIKAAKKLIEVVLPPDDINREAERNRLLKIIGEQQVIIDLQKNFKGVFVL